MSTPTQTPNTNTNTNTPAIVNLTPHDVRLRLQDGREVVYPASGRVARVATPPAVPDEAAGVPIIRRPAAGGRIDGLPEPAPGVLYIVSGAVLAALEAAGMHRQDVIAPATGPADGAVRDERGQIVAVSRFVGLPA